jgi:CHAT domain-containing protein
MLAEYIDGGLEPRERAEVEEHLADCGECYENFAEAVRAGASVPVAVTAPRTTTLRRPAFYALAAAAVVIVAVGFRTGWFIRGADPRLAELAEAVGDRRPAVARLTGGFEWGVPPPVTRGSSAVVQPTGAVTVAIGKIETALEHDRNPSTLRDHAIAEMVLGHPDAAVDALKEAAAIAPKDASVWSNLAAAYLIRIGSGDHASDVPAGYDAASTALSLEPQLAEALFNRALILERMNLRDRAADDWNAYLKIDPKSKWADEARAHLAALGKASEPRPPDAATERTKALEVDLAAWAASPFDSSAARTALASARNRAVATGRSSTDRLLTDVVENAVVASSAGAIAAGRLAAGIKTFLAAETSLKVQNREAARQQYADAIALLQPLRSPLGLAAASRLAEVRDDDYARRAVLSSISGRHYPSLEGGALWSLGMSAHANGQFTDAGDYYRRARASYLAADDRADVQALDGQLASLFDELGLIDDAWRDRLAALDGIATGPRTRKQQALFTTGAFWAKRADWPYVALLWSRESIDIAKELGDAVGVADALNQQAISYVAVGNHAAAVAAANEARTLITPALGSHFASLSAKMALTDAQLGLPDTAAAADRAGAAASYYASVNEMARLPEALALKANRLRANGQAEQARETLAQGLVEVAALQRQSAGAASIAYGDSRRPLIDEFVDLAIAQGRTAEAFDALEETRAVGGGRSLPLSTIQSQLAPNATLIVYALQRGKVTAFRVRQKDVRVAQTAIDDFALNRLVSAFAARPTAALGTALRRLLLDPVLSSGDAAMGPLGIVPDGILHRVPFPALPGAAQTFLIQERSILFGLSATSLAARAGRPDPVQFQPRQMTAVGASQFDRVLFPRLAALPQSEAEAQMVAAALPGARALVGSSATREALLDTLTHADGLHFSGHAVADELHPERSMLVIPGRDQPGVTAGQLAAMNLAHIRLAVLAACETASGAISRTAGPLSIVRSMADAGVNTIVASRTPLDDAVSMRLFRHFYEALAKTGDAAEALQQSQIAMINDPDRSISDPARWSGVMVLSGSEYTNESVSLREARRKR